jgi:hypothetical protein
MRVRAVDTIGALDILRSLAENRTTICDECAICDEPIPSAPGPRPTY